MTQAGNLYCNWCADLIVTGERFVRAKRNGKVYHYHNRNINDCYVEWAEEEDEEKARAKALSQQKLSPSPTKKPRW